MDRKYIPGPGAGPASEHSRRYDFRLQLYMCDINLVLVLPYKRFVMCKRARALAYTFIVWSAIMWLRLWSVAVAPQPPAQLRAHTSTGAHCSMINNSGARELRKKERVKFEEKASASAHGQMSPSFYRSVFITFELQIRMEALSKKKKHTHIHIDILQFIHSCSDGDRQISASRFSLLAWFHWLYALVCVSSGMAMRLQRDMPQRLSENIYIR